MKIEDLRAGARREVSRLLYEEGQRIMEESKRMRARASPELPMILPSGDMVRVRRGRLERFDDLLGWLDVCAVEEPTT